MKSAIEVSLEPRDWSLLSEPAEKYGKVLQLRDRTIQLLRVSKSAIRSRTSTKIGTFHTPAERSVWPCMSIVFGSPRCKLTLAVTLTRLSLSMLSSPNGIAEHRRTTSITIVEPACTPVGPHWLYSPALTCRMQIYRHLHFHRIQTVVLKTKGLWGVLRSI